MATTSFEPSGVNAKAEAPVDSTSSGRWERKMEVKSRMRLGLISPLSYDGVIMDGLTFCT